VSKWGKLWIALVALLLLALLCWMILSSQDGPPDTVYPL
jgi:hypothetical protein